MLPISCFIITKNEEKNIAKAITSVKKLASEILIIDSGSTDRTVEIAKSLGARVIEKDWLGYLEQKIYGENLCQYKWIINLDGDEELSEELQEEIEVITKTGLIEHYKAYKINFVILHRNDTKPRRFAPSNSFIRFYNKEFSGFKNNKGDSTHDDVKLSEGITNEKVFSLENPAWHRSGTSISQLITKANFYSSQQAEALLKKKRSFSNLRLLTEFWVWFFKAFFVRRYFIFGLDGFVDSMIFAFARFARTAKLRELYYSPNKDNK